MKGLLLYLLPVLCFAACQPQRPQANETNAQPAMDPTFAQLFEDLNVVKMHLFATQETAPDGEDYPYTGQPISGELEKYLGESLRPNPAGGVFACYRLENNGMFILRVPGKYVSGDLALARWDGTTRQLKKVIDLAYIQCDEGVCHQQDAWLTDLDDNRTLELITRSRSSDVNGKVVEESFTVMTDDGKVGFVKSDEKLASLALRENYVMKTQENKQANVQK